MSNYCWAYRCIRHSPLCTIQYSYSITPTTQLYPARNQCICSRLGDYIFCIKLLNLKSKTTFINSYLSQSMIRKGKGRTCEIGREEGGRRRWKRWSEVWNQSMGILVRREGKGRRRKKEMKWSGKQKNGNISQERREGKTEEEGDEVKWETKEWED